MIGRQFIACAEKNEQIRPVGTVNYVTLFTRFLVAYFMLTINSLPDRIATLVANSKHSIVPTGLFSLFRLTGNELPAYYRASLTGRNGYVPKLAFGCKQSKTFAVLPHRVLPFCPIMRRHFAP